MPEEDPEVQRGSVLCSGQVGPGLQLRQPTYGRACPSVALYGQKWLGQGASWPGAWSERGMESTELGGQSWASEPSHNSPTVSQV